MICGDNRAKQTRALVQVRGGGKYVDDNGNDDDDETDDDETMTVKSSMQSLHLSSFLGK